MWQDPLLTAAGEAALGPFNDVLAKNIILLLLEALPPARGVYDMYQSQKSLFGRWRRTEGGAGWRAGARWRGGAGWRGGPGALHLPA